MRSTACGDGGGSLGGHRPVEQREEDQLVVLDIDRHRVAGLDRGAPVEDVVEADETGAALVVDLGVAGPDIGEMQLGGRAHDKGVIRPRRRRQCQRGEQQCGGDPRRPPPQQPAQRIGDQQIDERQDQRRRQQRRAEIDLAGAPEGLAARRRRQLGDRLELAGSPADRLSARRASAVP